MILKQIRSYRTLINCKPLWNRNCIIDSLLKSRNIYNVQTLDYDLTAVYTMDMDPTGNFLLVGLSNGSVDLQGVQDPNLGTLDQISRLHLSSINLHRVQWYPGDERFFSMLDTHDLYLVDPVEMRAVDKFHFSSNLIWSEWNPNDKKMIAVCGTASQTRLVDIRSGSSVQTIILGARSGLASHRATRCLWSRQDTTCLIVGDNEGYLHVYDTRNSTRPLLYAGEEHGQISGMSFTTDQSSIITSQGTENHLVQWSYDRGSLRAWPKKFRKQRVAQESEIGVIGNEHAASQSSTHVSLSKSKKLLSKKGLGGKQTKRIVPLPLDAYLRCQLYVTDRHIYCPVPSKTKKSKELHIYDIENGYRIKTLKSDDILCQGIYSVIGSLPDSMVLYVGGRGRLRVWGIDEDYHRKMEEKINKFHTTRWDSDEEN